MKLFNYVFFSVSLCLFAFTMYGQDMDDESHLSYSIPDNAVKVGPRAGRGGIISTTYLNPDTDDINKKLVGIEFFDKKTKKRTKLVLYKNRKKHGVQKEWYKDGFPKSEAPYKNDIMHGVFKHWDDKGNLVGFYRILNGTGVKKVFFSNGKVKEKREFQNNKITGESFVFYNSGQANSLNWKKDGLYYTDGFAFHENGKLYCYGKFETRAQLNGPTVYFSKTGQPIEKELVYYIHGKKVTKEEYLEASEKDSTLPKLEEDLEKYKEYALEKTQAIIDKYKNMEPVEIPLLEPTPNE